MYLLIYLLVMIIVYIVSFKTDFTKENIEKVTPVIIFTGIIVMGLSVLSIIL